MDYSKKISERLWNLPDKGELESRREQTYIDTSCKKAILNENCFPAWTASKPCSMVEQDAAGFPSCLQNVAARSRTLIFPAP